MDWNALAQLVRKKLFEIITVVLAVLAIVFACIQYGDSRKQLHQSAVQLEQSQTQLQQLANITSSIQTSYVGEFPHNMDEIMNVVNNVSEHGELDIMTDFAGYAIYSRNAAYQNYFNALIHDRQRKVAIKMLVYDQELADVALRIQFKQSDFLEEKKTGFRGFFENHPPTPVNYEEFVTLILKLQDHAVGAMCDNGIEVRRVPKSQKYLFFLWGNNSPQAVFAFRNEAAKNRELSFRSVDRSLIEVFKTVFDQAWENADPQRHAELHRACQDFQNPS
jgi:hypothetical protein